MSGFRPRVFQSKTDGSVVVQTEFRDRMYRLTYVGPVAERLFGNNARFRILAEELVQTDQALDFEELVPEGEARQRGYNEAVAQYEEKRINEQGIPSPGHLEEKGQETPPS